MSTTIQPKLTMKEQAKADRHAAILIAGMQRDCQRHAANCSRYARCQVEDGPTIEPIRLGNEMILSGIKLETEYLRGSLRLSETCAARLAPELGISDDAADRLRVKTCSCGERFLADHTVEKCSATCTSV